MNKRTLLKPVTLSLLLTGMTFSAVSLAERPYEASSPWASQVEDTTSSQADSRPAAAEEETVETQTQTTGDVLSMPVAEPEAPEAMAQQPAASSEAVAQAVRTVDFPRRGMSQEKVQNELGRPVEIVPAVGTPPISRWIYDDRVVYFEYASVIHVVAK